MSITLGVRFLVGLTLLESCTERVIIAEMAKVCLLRMPGSMDFLDQPCNLQSERRLVTARDEGRTKR